MEEPLTRTPLSGDDDRSARRSVDVAATPPGSLDVWRRDIEASIAVKQRLLADDALLRRALHVAQTMAEAAARGNRVLFAGNGGSAADAQHLAAEFVSRFEFDRPGLPALSLASWFWR